MADKRGGVDVDDPEKAKKKKQMVIAGCTLGLAAVIVFWQYGPSSNPDPDVAKSPEVKSVIEAEQKQDTQRLTSLIKSQDDLVAARAAASLATVAPDTVRDYASDRRSQVRMAAVSGLGSSSDPARLPALQSFTKDPEPSVRAAAAASIANIDDFKIFDELIPMLNDPSGEVRGTAYAAIQSRIGMSFPDYNPAGSPAERAKGIAKIRQQISKMKQVFDRSVAFEKQRRAGRR